MKKELKQALNSFIDNLKDSDIVDYSCEFGRNEIISLSGYKEFKSNDTATIAIKVNGGAQDRIVDELLESVKLFSLRKLKRKINNHFMTGQ